jgi:hypothetical protein
MHRLSPDDVQFRSDFEAGTFRPAGFDHRAHMRLAYVYLVGYEFDEALAQLRDGLIRFVERNGIDPSKYHETMTNAWLLAVRHFMTITPARASADAFIDANPILLDSKIMLTHYSAEHLFSTDARLKFVEPDLDPIPRHDR